MDEVFRELMLFLAGCTLMAVILFVCVEAVCRWLEKRHAEQLVGEHLDEIVVATKRQAQARAHLDRDMDDITAALAAFGAPSTGTSGIGLHAMQFGAGAPAGLLVGSAPWGSPVIDCGPVPQI